MRVLRWDWAFVYRGGFTRDNCEEGQSPDVAIRIPCGAKHHPAPPGPEGGRIATALRPRNDSELCVAPVAVAGAVVRLGRRGHAPALQRKYENTAEREPQAVPFRKNPAYSAEII